MADETDSLLQQRMPYSAATQGIDMD